MIKVGRYKVNPHEIERAIHQCFDVADVAIIGMADEVQEESIVAVVVPIADTDPEAIRKHCNDCLPGYMAPSRILLVEALPIGANGKVSKQKLIDFVQKSPRGRAT